MEDYRKMLKDAVTTDGLQFCLDALQEECGELVAAISHLRRKRVGDRRVIEEMANVSLMLDMCRMGMDDEVGFCDEIERKSKKIGDVIRWKKQPSSKR